MSEFNKGDRVRFTTDNLGLLPSPESNRILKRVVNSGDEGIYDYPDTEMKGWHYVRVTVDGQEAWCPVQATSIEKVEP